MNKYYVFLSACLLLTLGSCSYNVEEELYPPDECDTTTVSYSEDIAPIIVTRCYECHDQQAVPSGIRLDGHANLKNIVDAGRLIGALRHENGFSPMPKDRGSLPECEILKIEKWVQDGALNN